MIHEAETPNICKIGVTANPRALLSTMQSLNWRALRLAAALRVPDREKAWEIAQTIKARLARFRCIGEWLAIDPDRVVSELAAVGCGSTLALEPELDYIRGPRGGARPGAGRPRNPEPGSSAERL